MRIRFYHALLATLSESAPLVPGELHTADDVIEYVGPDAPDETARFDREIDCGGGLLLPGFCNAHSHAGMTFLRSFADDLPLQAWLTQKVFPYEARLTEADAYIFTKLAILEYLSGGITSMFDMYMHNDAIADACIDTGFRAVLMDGVNNYGGSPESTAAEYARISNRSPLVSYQFGLHAEYTTDEKLIRGMIELSHAYKKPFFSHASETREETEGCLARRGKTPIAYLDSLGAFEYGGAAFHCVYATERERDIMAEKGVFAVTCPASNLKLGSGVAPIVEFLERGVPLAIGTDGPASNNALDFFREMYLVSCLQKVRRSPDAFSALAVLKMATRGGALAMGRPDCGLLEPGMQADLTLISQNRPNMQPVHDPLKNLVYAGGKQDVALTMVAGRILYENGRCFIGEEPEAVYEKANAAVKRIFGA